MTDLVRLSVIVPCYNEEKNIPEVVGNFARVLKQEKGAELILVDNGSRDQTGAAIDREIAAQGLSIARKVTVPVNQGYGFGILSGLAAARGECLAWTHADLQTDPEDVLKAYTYYKEDPAGRTLLKGCRRGRKLSEKAFSLGMQVLSSLALGVWLSEVNAQPKLFPRALFEEMKDAAPHDFSLDLYLLYLAKKKGYAIRSFPVYFRDRKHGEAKGGGGSFRNRWKLIRRTFAYIFELKRQVSKVS